MRVCEWNVQSIPGPSLIRFAFEGQHHERWLSGETFVSVNFYTTTHTIIKIPLRGMLYWLRITLYCIRYMVYGSSQCHKLWNNICISLLLFLFQFGAEVNCAPHCFPSFQDLHYTGKYTTLWIIMNFSSNSSIECNHYNLRGGTAQWESMLVSN